MQPSLVILMAGCLFFALPFRSGASDIAKTTHNLSVTGPGEYKALKETEICIFCHSPHNAQPGTPLWSHNASDVKSYKVYSSASMEARSEQPDGSSKLCLSCHDGTVALGAVRTREKPISMAPGAEILKPGSRGYIGTDLSGSHPLSFVVTRELIEKKNTRAREISGLKTLEGMISDKDGVKLDAKKKVQCTSCHDPHSDKYFESSGVHFWRKPAWSDVCEVCHDM